MTRTLSIVVALAACGDNEQRPIDAAPIDEVAPAIDAPPPLPCPWTGAFTLTAATRIDTIASTDHDSDPVLSSDRLELYFASTRAGGPGDSDLYLASRAALTDPFGAVTAVADLSTTGAETRLTLAADGTAWLSSVRGLSADLYSTRRTAPNAFATELLELGLSSPSDDVDPSVTPDGLVLYIRRQYGAGDSEILVTKRPSTGDSFPLPIGIAELASAEDDGDPAIVGDDRLLVFTSARPGGVGGVDLWYATRPEVSMRWSAPMLVPGLNTLDAEVDPFVSADGCELWFASDRAGGAGMLDIYRSTYSTP